MASKPSGQKEAGRWHNKAKRYSEVPAPQRHKENRGGGACAGADVLADQDITIAVMGASRVGKTALSAQFLWGVFPENYVSTLDDTNWVEYELRLPKPSGQHHQLQQEQHCVGAKLAEANESQQQRSKQRSTSSDERRRSSAASSDSAGSAGHRWRLHAAPPDAIVLLKIIDTGGTNDFPAMRRLYEETSDAFLVVYDVCAEATWTEAEALCTDIMSRNTKAAPIVLVGNKADTLPDSDDEEEDERDSEAGAQRTRVAKAAGEFAAAHRLPLFLLSAKDGDKVRDAFRQLILCLPRMGKLGEEALRKRRQSMPAAASGHRRGSFDPADLRRIQEAAARASGKGTSKCNIS